MKLLFTLIPIALKNPTTAGLDEYLANDSELDSYFYDD